MARGRHSHKPNTLVKKCHLWRVACDVHSRTCHLELQDMPRQTFVRPRRRHSHLVWQLMHQLDESLL
jgi:hypothetical protein